MAKTRKKSPIPGGVLALLLLALLVFLGGEAWVLIGTEGGQIRLARWFPGHRVESLERILGERIHRGLTAAEVAKDSVREERNPRGPAPLRWRVGLRPEQSLLQTNYAITHYVEERGGSVLSGRELAGAKGATEVRLVVGLPKQPTHEVVLVRGLRSDPKEAPGGRLALVLFGFGDDPKEAEAIFKLPAPFAVAIAAGAPWSNAMFKSAHAASREVVLFLPLEPINYPRMSPGPGTLQVTMRPEQIGGLTRKYVDQASPAVAVANLMGSLATQDMSVMGAVYRELKRRRMPFVHVMPAAGSVCRTLAADVGVVYDEPDAVIEGETRASKSKALDSRWNEILKRARTRSHMMVWVRATPLTRQWLAKAVTPKRLDGVAIVPVASLLKKAADL